MTAKNLLNFFDELLEEPEKYGSVEEMTSKSLSLFNELVEQIKHSTPEERIKINDQLEEASRKMSEKFEGMCQQYGISRAQMESMMNDPSNFNSETWGSIQNLKEEIEEGRKDLVKTFNPNAEKPTKKAKKKGTSKNKKWLTA